MSTLFTAPTWPIPVYDAGFSQSAKAFTNAFNTYTWPPGFPVGFPMMIQVTTVVGKVYNYIQADSLGLASGRGTVPIPGGGFVPVGPDIPPGQFTATQTTYWLYSASPTAEIGNPVEARVLLVG